MTKALVLVNSVMYEFASAINNYLFWTVMAVVALQYKKIAKTRQEMFGIGGNTVVRDTLVATGYGLAGGLAASFLLVFTGVNLTSLGIGYLWVLALLLMLINPRFLCFSYAGGIIAVSKLIFGTPDIDIPQLMGLIAVLHLIESLLIYFSGHAGATPMFTKREDGSLVGGFTLQKFWPLPVVAVAVLTYPEAMGYTVLPEMPAWWPAIKFGQEFSLTSVGVLLPIVVGLGYGDIAVAHTPVEKSRMSATNLSVFSVVLLFLSVLASRYGVFEIVAALFAPLGHEAVIYLGKRTEMNGKPLYVRPEQGVRVLETLPDSPARKAGLASGDVIININGYIVNSKRDIDYIILTQPGLAEIVYMVHRQNRWRKEQVRVRPNQVLGIIAVPEGNESIYTELRNRSVISRITGKLRSLIKGKL